MTKKAETVLITGGAGFIGHHVVEHILKTTNWNIIILDRLSYAGNLNRLVDISIWDKCYNEGRVKFFYHDFRSSFTEDKVLQLMGLYNRLDYILHIGAESHVDRSIENPFPFVENNVIGTVNMLDLAYKLTTQNYLKCFILLSTDESYGPVKEELHTEEAPHKPSNPYSASKAASEDFCLAYQNTYDLPIIITNFMNTFGERQNSEKFVPNVVKRIMNGEEIIIHCQKDKEGSILDISSRCWIHARNVADALTALLKYGRIGEKYNVAGKKMDVYEMAKMIGKILNRKINPGFEDFHNFRPGHDMHYGLDSSKIRNEIGWAPPLDLEESLRKTVKWIINNPKWL